MQATDRAAGVDLMTPHQVRPEVTEKVSEAVMWALEVKVDQRPQNVSDFLWALDTGHAPLAVIGDMSSGPQSVTLYQPGERFAGDTLAWPQQCACCGEASDSTLPVIYLSQGQVTKDSRGWLVPYCSECIQHVEASRAGLWTSLYQTGAIKAMAWTFALAVFAAFFFFQDKWFIPLLFWVFIAGGITYHRRQNVVTGKLKSSCCAALPAVTCVGVKHGRRTAYTLHFKNSLYETAFKGLNAPKI